MHAAAAKATKSQVDLSAATKSRRAVHVPHHGDSDACNGTAETEAGGEATGHEGEASADPMHRSLHRSLHQIRLIVKAKFDAKLRVQHSLESSSLAKLNRAELAILEQVLHGHALCFHVSLHRLMPPLPFPSLPVH